jgi:protease II
MNSVYFSVAIVALVMAGIAPIFGPIPGDKVTYPDTRRVDHVDTYFGEKVPDPYRWLEDENAPETAKWVQEQNKVTFGYLRKIPYRRKIKARLEKIINYPRYGAPSSSRKTTDSRTRASITYKRVSRERRRF